jgi:hypothetical protein
VRQRPGRKRAPRVTAESARASYGGGRVGSPAEGLHRGGCCIAPRKAAGKPAASTGETGVRSGGWAHRPRVPAEVVTTPQRQPASPLHHGTARIEKAPQGARLFPPRRQGCRPTSQHRSGSPVLQPSDLVIGCCVEPQDRTKKAPYGSGGKPGTERRPVPASVHPMQGDEIRALRRLLREQRASPHVFDSERGGPTTPKAFQFLFVRIDARAKMPFRCILTCCGMAADMPWPTLGTTPGRCKLGSGTRNIQHIVRYTEMAPDRFKGFWR